MDSRATVTRQRQAASIGRAWSFLAAILLCSLVLSACLSRKPPKLSGPQRGDRGGEILVDSPEVFARERLIRDRELQKKWLREQLEVPADWFDAQQAAVQSRALSSMGLTLGVDATPAAGLAIRQAGAEQETLAREQEVAELEHQIRLAQLEAELERARAGEPPSQVAVPTTSGGTTPTTPGSGAGSDSGGSVSTPPTGTSLGAGGAGGSAPAVPGLPAFVAAPTTALHDTPIERFRDRLVYREIVRQELLENDLDDSHDIAGNTLYRLTFDTTVLPAGEDSGQWAQVTVEPARGDCNVHHIGPFLQRLRADLQDFLRAEAFTYRDALLADDLRQFYDSEVAAWASASRIDFLASWKDDEGSRAPEAVVDAQRRADLEVEKRYGPLLKRSEFDDVLQIQRPCDSNEPGCSPVGDQSAIMVDLQGSETDAVEAFCKLATGLPSRVEPYAVTPKESVDRIADASIARFDQQSAISAGIAAGTVNLAAALKYMSALENQREAVRRESVVVGWASRAGQASKFGWALAPRFKPRYIGPGFDFRQRAIQLPLSAVVSVPGWWTSMELQVTTGWGRSPSATPNSTYTYQVALPGDAKSLVEVLFPRARRPQPFFYGESPNLEIGRKERLAIYGTNLWRNPQVHIGTQPADEVEILPDMQGIVATFEKVAEPAGWTVSQQFGPVSTWVWTSEGSAPAGDVRLHRAPVPRPKDSPKPHFTPTISSTRIQPGLDRKAAVIFEIEFETLEVDDPAHPGKKIDKQIATEVFVEIENGTVDGAATMAANTGSTCFVSSSIPWKATADCRIEIHFQALVTGQVITVKTYRKEGKAKIAADPLSIEVR